MSDAQENHDAQLVAHSRIAGHKVPSSVEFVDQLPVSAAGKILERDLRAARSRAVDQATAEPAQGTGALS